MVNDSTKSIIKKYIKDLCESFDVSLVDIQNILDELLVENPQTEFTQQQLDEVDFICMITESIDKRKSV